MRYALFAAAAACAVPALADAVPGPTPVVNHHVYARVPEPTMAPVVKARQVGNGDMTWNLVNQMNTPLSLVYESNAGFPAPIGNPTNGLLQSTTQVVFPSGWAGRITVGPNADTRGSKIEGSALGQYHVDVSYVDGYTVPITCKDDLTGQTFIGCNIDLFNNGQTCEEPGAPGAGICYNLDTAMNAFNGPPKPFFADCQKVAYTYPKDDLADRALAAGSNSMTCCIGPTCEAPADQIHKRDMNPVAKRWTVKRSQWEEQARRWEEANN